ncbi:MAG: hypothetical protein V7K26_23635 [Nostoc sp.]|uniref:hypothetical protein n=1 Tax=Nostoc sp. TaxID=1180 RepID=UPI002FF1D481
MIILSTIALTLPQQAIALFLRFFVRRRRSPSKTSLFGSVILRGWDIEVLSQLV